MATLGLRLYQGTSEEANYSKSTIFINIACTDPESFVRGGLLKSDNVFLVDEGIEDPNITINGPSSAPTCPPSGSAHVTGRSKCYFKVPL